MTKKISSSLIILISLLIFPAMTGLNPVRADEQYTANVLYTIPWGDDPGMINTLWNENPGIELIIFPPNPWAVSSTGEMVIAQEIINEQQLMKFSSDGIFINRINLFQQSLPYAQGCSTGETGEVLIGSGRKLCLLDSSLNVLLLAEIPHPDAYISQIFPSDSGSFWVIYDTSSRKVDNIWYIDYCLIEFSQDGSMSEPQELSFAGTWEELDEMEKFVTPSGTLKQYIEDIYGYNYRFTGEEPGTHLVKRSTEGEIVYTHDLYSDPGWELWEGLGGVHHFVTWSGDFYTLHATDDGAVLTYYELNLPPDCLILIVTSMPYQGPSPAAIEFDATHSGDPNEGDTLTFEWDFDGDRIFGEPGDDDYTGDPDNPTHEYTSDYDGPVFLRVTDNHGAFSICSVSIIVEIV